MGHTEIKVDNSNTNNVTNKKIPPKFRGKRPKSFIEYMIRIFSIIICILLVHVIFFIQSIQVKNNQLIEDSEILAWINEDAFAFNSLYLWVKYNFTDIEYPAQVEDIRVTMKSPWQITINVTDKALIGGVVTMQGYAYYDMDGIVLRKTTEPLEGVMVFEGIKVEEPELYAKLPVENMEIFEKILEVGGLMEAESLVPDTVLQDGEDIILEFGSISVVLGDGNFDFKVRHIQPILQELEGKEGVLNLKNYNTSDDMITFK